MALLLRHLLRQRFPILWESLRVLRFVTLAGSFRDVFPLFIVGCAAVRRGAETGALASILQRRFPSLLVRPRGVGEFTLEIKLDDFTHHIVFDEIFLQHNYDLSLVPFRPSLIVDCGGHIGYFSAIAATHFPDTPLTVLEPNPENCAFIRRFFERNHVALELLQVAASTKDGTAEFVSRRSCSGALQTSTGPDDVTYTVKTLNLARFIAEKSPGRLLLKIDVEGEETHIMPDLLPVLPADCAIFLETHDGERGWRTMEAFLRQNGFEVRQLNFRHGVFVDSFAWRTVGLQRNPKG